METYFVEILCLKLTLFQLNFSKFHNIQYFNSLIIFQRYV